MRNEDTGALLRTLRREAGMTQAQAARQLGVSPQAVSKWERGQGCPDVAVLPELARLFGVSLAGLLAGDLAPGPMEVGNMKRIQFYMCPDCGNILTAAGGGELHCCGRRLEPLKPRPADEATPSRSRRWRRTGTRPSPTLWKRATISALPPGQGWTG